MFYGTQMKCKIRSFSLNNFFQFDVGWVLNDEDVEHLLDPQYLLNDDEITRLAQKVRLPLSSSDSNSSTIEEFIFEHERSDKRFIFLGADDAEKMFAHNCKFVQFLRDISGIIICLPHSYYDEHLISQNVCENLQGILSLQILSYHKQHTNTYLMAKN